MPEGKEASSSRSTYPMCPLNREKVGPLHIDDHGVLASDVFAKVPAAVVGSPDE